MGLTQCFVIVLMLSAQLVLTYPTTEQADWYELNGKKCRLCPPGEFQKFCTECAPCPAESYTATLNREKSCQPCYRDCNPAFHLKVVQNCTSKSDMKCVCETGFTCSRKATLSENCIYCDKNLETTSTKTSTTATTTTTTTAATEAAALNPAKDKQTPSSASTGHSSTSDKPCQYPKCGSQTVESAGNLTSQTHLKTGNTSSQLAAILCPVVVMGFLALVILFFVRRPGDESCFKQAIALLPCSEGGRAASHKSKESTHQFPRDSFSARQQPSGHSAANLGPVHVYNPGTVIFSLLSQFTGQVGPTIECGKTAERESAEEEDERDCPVFHPTASPSIHLSEEERSGEIDSIFFPSQEQGKDCHMSKEEVL
ncbi:uncharacterized protein ABDE67_006362 [Symphorus nematophorus]